MVQRINSMGLVRVNKTRARKMFDNNYPVIITMDSDFIDVGAEYQNFDTIYKPSTSKCFDYLIADYYELHKGEQMSYRVEYWVLENDNHEYLYYMQKPYNDRYQAKKHHK